MTTPLGQVTGELQDVREWTTNGSPPSVPSVSATKANTGSYSIAIGDNYKAFGLSFPAAQNSFRAGVWINHTGLNASQLYYRADIFKVITATQTWIVAWKVAGDGIGIILGTVTQAVIPAAAANGFSVLDAWHHIGLNYRTGAGGGISFWVNGVNVLSFASDLLEPAVGVYVGGNTTTTNTSATPLTVGVTTVGGVRGWANFAYFDDLYADGEIQTDEMPAPDRFLFGPAVGAGSSAQWTPTGAATNVECVDEAVPDDDTTYVKADAAGLTDLFTISPITLPNDYSIASVLPVVLAKRLAAGPTLRLVANDGVNPTAESADKTPPSAYGYVWDSMALAPDGSDWVSAARVNATQFGIKSTGVYA